MTEFKVGDHVDWLGAKGKVVEVIVTPNDFPVVVHIDKYRVYFSTDGRFHKNQIPSLKKIEPKKIERWAIVHSDGNIDTICATKEEAEENAIKWLSGKVVRFVKLTGEYYE